MASPLQVACSRQAHGFSTQKKKKEKENQKLNPSCCWRLAESHHVASLLAERSNPNTKANQTQRTQQTKHRAHRCLSKKKKKIPNTQTKTKPSNPQTVKSTQRAHRRRRRSPDCPSSQIGDRRTQIALPFLRCSVLATRCSL